MHWLDDVLNTLKREADRWRAADGAKAEAHDTAHALLTQVRDSGVTHEEAKDHLASKAEREADPNADDASGVNGTTAGTASDQPPGHDPNVDSEGTV